MSFGRIGLEQGLSQGAVTAVLQDQRGFLWLGTEDGLNRYDGRELKHFIHRLQDPASLPSNWVSALGEDARGRLWVIGTNPRKLVERKGIEPSTFALRTRRSPS